MENDYTELKKTTLRKKQTPDTNIMLYRCPKCKYIIAIENKIIQDTVIACPNCEQKNILLPSKQLEKKYEESNKHNIRFSQIIFNTLIIGLILTLTSIVLLLFIQNPLTTKLSLTLLLIGVICPFFITKKEQNFSMKITLGTILCIILLFLVTGKDIEIFLILIFPGILIIKTAITKYLHKSLRNRMNLFLSFFFIIFVIFVIKRIINLVNM